MASAKGARGSLADGTETDIAVERLCRIGSGGNQQAVTRTYTHFGQFRSRKVARSGKSEHAHLEL